MLERTRALSAPAKSGRRTPFDAGDFRIASSADSRPDAAQCLEWARPARHAHDAAVGAVAFTSSTCGSAFVQTLEAVHVEDAPMQDRYSTRLRGDRLGPLAGDLVKQEPRQHQSARHAEEISNSVFHGTSRSYSSNYFSKYLCCRSNPLRCTLERIGRRQKHLTSTEHADGHCYFFPQKSRRTSVSHFLWCACRGESGVPRRDSFRSSASVGRFASGSVSISSSGDARSFLVRRGHVANPPLLSRRFDRDASASLWRFAC